MRAIPMIVVALAASAVMGCSNRSKTVQAAELTGGNPKSGKNKIAYYGCGSCHDIKGIPGAIGLVGPPLDNVAMRVYLGGVLQNSPNNMALWIMNPKQFDEKTAMPNLHVTQSDAIDITAYLYSLQ